jgi:hypothetical protein
LGTKKSTSKGTLGDKKMNSQKTIKKYRTPCCAMCLLHDLDNSTTEESLEKLITKLKKEKENNKEVGISTGKGQTFVQAVVSPGEHLLEQTLKNVGFHFLFNFERRVGYPPGHLKMYGKHL